MGKPLVSQEKTRKALGALARFWHEFSKRFGDKGTRFAVYDPSNPPPKEEEQRPPVGTIIEQGDT